MLLESMNIPLRYHMIKEIWIVKMKEIGSWAKELITFVSFFFFFLPLSACSKKLPKFSVMHVDLN